MRCGGSFCIFSAKAGARERGSAGLFGAAFVRGGVGGAVAAGIQDRGKLLQLLERADPQLFVDVLVVEAQGAVLDVQLLHDLPGAQPGHIAVKDAALGLCQVGDALQKGLEGIGDRFVAAHVRQPGKFCLHLLALHLQLVHPPSGLPPVLLKLPERRREDVLVEVHAAEHHKKEDEQADQQHLQVAGKDQPAVVRHGDADGQPVGLVLVQAAKLRDACIGAVGADQLGQAAAHAAQHQHVPGGMEVAAGGAAAEGGAGVQPAVCRGKQADQVVKAGGLGKVLLEKALADLKAAQPVHGAIAAPQGQQKQLYLLRGAGEAEPLRQRISLVQRGAAGGHPAVVVRELVGLEFHAPFAVGHYAVGLAHIGAAAVEQQGHGGGVGTAFLHIEPGAGVPGPLHAGVDSGIQQHKGTGAAGPAQAAAERLDHLLLQRVQHLGGVVQLLKGHLPAGKLLIHQSAHILGEVHAHDRQLVKIALHIVLEHRILDLQAAGGVLFGVVQAGKQEQRRAKGQQQQRSQQQAGPQQPGTHGVLADILTVPGKKVHQSSPFLAVLRVQALSHSSCQVSSVRASSVSPLARRWG